MIKWEKIEAGMTLYDRHRRKAGNTTRSVVGEWPVKIISVDRERETAEASWNGNAPRTMYRRNLEKLFRASKRTEG